MIDFDAIRELREQHEWTQEMMAEKLGISRNGYAKIERGESTPSLERLTEIANIFGVKLFELLKLDSTKVIYQNSYNNGGNNHNYYSHEKTASSIETLQNEIDKLNMVITHKDEIIAQKDEYINTLKQLLSLKNKKDDMVLIEL